MTTLAAVHERRRYRRKAVSRWSANLSGANEVLRATVCDISLGGAKLSMLTPAVPSLNDHTWVELRAGDDAPVGLEAEVLSVEPSSSGEGRVVRVRFTRLTGAAAMLLLDEVAER